MSMALDIILLVLWVIFIADGAKKGFLHTLLEFVAFIVAMVAAYQLSAHFAPWIYAEWLEPKVILALQDILPANGGTAVQQAQAILSSIPEEAAAFVQSLGIDVNSLAKQIGELHITSSGQFAKVLADKVGGPIVIQVCKWIIFSAFAIGISVALKIILSVIGGRIGFPAVISADTAIGGVLGGVKGLFVVALVCMIARLVVDVFPNINESLVDVVNSSFIADTINSFNPVLKAMHGISFTY